ACRFDGSDFTTFDRDDGLAGNKVYKITEDREGQVWFATSTGASRFDEQSFRSFNEHDGLRGESVRNILQDRRGYVWLATNRGASRFDGSTFTNYGKSDGLAANYAYGILEDTRGWIWIVHWGVVTRYDGQSFTVFSGRDGLPGSRINKIAEDGRGHLWFTTWGRGLSRYDGERFQRFTEEDGLVSNWVWGPATHVDGEGRPWFGTWSGLSVFDTDGFLSFAARDGVASSTCSAILQDRSGAMWIGHGFGGSISQFEGDTWKTYERAGGPTNSVVFTMLKDSKGDLWFSSIGEGVTRYDGRAFTVFGEEGGLADDRIHSLFEDTDGAMWLGHHRGVTRVLGDQGTTFTPADGLPSRTILGMNRDRNGMLWLCTPNGAVRLDGRSLSIYTREDGLCSNRLYELPMDANGDLWFCSGDMWDAARSGSGVTRYDGEQFTTFTSADGLASDWISIVHQARDGVWWFGTNRGVTRFDGTEWKTYTGEDGLAHDAVHAVFQDAAGHMWFGTSGGVSRFDGEAFTSYREGEAPNGGHVRSILQEPSGAMWFGTGHGAVRYVKPPASPPSVRIDAVVADRRYTDLDALSVPSTSGLVTFEFSGSSYRTPHEAIVYRYKLDGHDQEWQTISEPQVEYQDLPTGSYTFTVQAVDRDLVYSNAPAKVVLTVHLPYDRIGLAAGLGIALILVAWQTVRVLRRDRRLQESVAALSDANKELFGANQQLQREGAVARVRSQVQAMEQASDFERVLSLVSEDLEAAGLTFDTCGIDVLDEPVDDPTMATFERHGFGYTAYKLDPEGSLEQESYNLSAPFPEVYREMIERFVEGEPWQALVGGTNAIVEVPITSYGRLRLTASDRQTFTDGDIDTLRDFAAAIALGYARYLDIREIQLQTERKSSFLASMSHELRTPMNAIIGFTNMVLRREGDRLSDRQRGNLSSVIDAGKRLLGLINDLMDLSKIEAGRMDVEAKRFSVDVLVRSCCAEVEPLVKPGVKLACDVSADVGDAQTDEGRVRQILTNLLSNAIKFTEQGQVTVRALKDADDMVITVADTGAGIPQDQLDTIFEEFQQVKGSDAERKGTGLGLPICKGFAELLGGSIRVTSEVGAGSTFTLRIPMVYGEGAENL
ncbi:MAG: two-component regulator propeller domain-containing protein, partial [Candidatus Latescibacteria bacterium]|nr:two-component regulator propeller domain-containing protein [Candidatus Latescibacterota bacterium]